MATDGDACDSSTGEIIEIDLTDELDIVIDPAIQKRTGAEWLKPTPEQIHFKEATGDDIYKVKYELAARSSIIHNIDVWNMCRGARAEQL